MKNNDFYRADFFPSLYNVDRTVFFRPCPRDRDSTGTHEVNFLLPITAMTARWFRRFHAGVYRSHDNTGLLVWGAHVL